MRISVIIPVYNEEKNIAKTIESLIKQTLNDYEIIAVNDGSTDKSVEILNKYRDKIKVIDKKQNGGQAKALNAGLKIASGSIIARTDGDSIVPSDWLERIHDNFKNNNIIAVGGFLTTIDENSYWALSNSFKDVIFNSFFKKIVTPNILPGANNAVLASELKVIGGYSDKKKYSEDSFLFFELSKRGKIMRDDNLIVRTRYPERFRDSLKRKFFWGVAGSSFLGNINIYKFYLRPIYYFSLIIFLFLAMIGHIYSPILFIISGYMFLFIIFPMTMGIFLVSIFYIFKNKDYKYLKILPTSLFYPFFLELVYFMGLVYGIIGGKVKIWREV